MPLDQPEPENAPGERHFAIALDLFNSMFKSQEPGGRVIMTNEGGELAIFTVAGNSWGGDGAMFARITDKNRTVIGIYDFKKDIKILVRVGNQWLPVEDERALAIPKNEREIKIVNNDGEELILLGKPKS